MSPIYKEDSILYQTADSRLSAALMQDPELFWVVWRPDGNTPMKKHTDFNTASAEAIRVARKENAKVYVLRAVQVSEPQSVVTRHISP